MKYLLLSLIILLTSLSSFAQREKFDCSNINKSSIKNCFDTYKGKGVKLNYHIKTKDGIIEVVEEMIDRMDYSDLTQLCINAWHDNYKEGESYMYNQFVKKFGYLSKEDYLNNNDYLEVIHQIHKILDKM